MLRFFALLPITLGSAGCEYAGLLRPNVLSELNPPVVRLVDDLQRSCLVHLIQVGWECLSRHAEREGAPCGSVADVEAPSVEDLLRLPRPSDLGRRASEDLHVD